MHSEELPAGRLGSEGRQTSMSQGLKEGGAL